jgi:predicted MPP superfamily phosphohydrolase
MLRQRNMGRGKNYSFWRKASDAIEAGVFAEGWAARGAYSLGLQGRLHIDRRDIHLPIQPCLAEPLRVAFASDIHAGPLTDPRLFDILLNAISTFSPHILLLGGDYVSHHHRHVNKLTDRLGQLNMPGGIFGVFGNHDLWADDVFLKHEMQKAGVRMLMNESVRLPHPHQQISLCGLDDPYTGDPDPVPTFRNTEKHRILLMHSPLGLKYIRDFSFELAFCGHTHGGQIALPWGRPIILPPGSGERRFSNGNFQLPEGGKLIASRGVGMSGVPIRLFAPSEVHLCTIHSAASRIQI